MGMVPEAAIAMLACARIGATHSVIFGGFAADALRDRINDCAGQGAHHAGRRAGAAGNVVPLKEKVDNALEQMPEHREGRSSSGASANNARSTMKAGRDV